MKAPAFLLFVPALLTAMGGESRAEQDGPSIQYFACEYRVVGVDPDTQEPYQGVCRIQGNEDGSYSMIRIINGEKVVGEVAVEDRETYEGYPIKRVVATFERDGSSYVITYTWQNSVDNHPLLTGDTQRVGVERSIADGFEMLKPVTFGDSLEKKLLDEVERIEDPASEEGRGQTEALERLLRAITVREDDGE